MSTLKVTSVRRIKDGIGRDKEGNEVKIPTVSVEFRQQIDRPSQTGGGLTALFMQGDVRFERKAQPHFQRMTATSAVNIFPELKQYVSQAVQKGITGYDDRTKCDVVIQGIKDRDGSYVPLAIQISEGFEPRDWDRRELDAKKMPSDEGLKYMLKDGKPIYAYTELVPEAQLNNVFIQYDETTLKFPGVRTEHVEFNTAKDNEEELQPSTTDEKSPF